MNETEICIFLKQKLEILEHIRSNTELQSRFIDRREMRGLGRLLRERMVWIEQLSSLNVELEQQEHQKLTDDIKSVVGSIAAMEKQILHANDQLLQQALGEKKKIAAELHKFRKLRQAKDQYEQPWAVSIQGGQLNMKG